ncbi:hypothetical protein BASA81_004106 [Batrachochytrium salamandrivorans]|nr:hypothetical protein BASA81_004106 [Batrachochytrium salamandrivorans]
MLSFALFVLLLVGLSDLASFATAKRLAGEGQHFLVLQHDGQGSIVKGTGFNGNYQLGDGTNAERNMLVSALGLDSGIEEVYCGYYGSCARMTSGESPVLGLFCQRGQNLSRQRHGLRRHPVHVPGKRARLHCGGLAAENIVSVACGYSHACAVDAAGAMFCWGAYSFGQLGNSSITVDFPNPVQVTGITSGVVSAWAGWFNSFALMQNGTVWAFGKDGYGVFGTGSTGNQLAPIAFGQGVSGVVEIRGGRYATCVLLQNDRVWCTGRNTNGQLGVGNTTNFQTLVEMVGIPATQSPTSFTLEPNY